MPVQTNRRWASCLRPKALIINPRLILVTHTDDLGCYVMSNQHWKILVQNLSRIVGKRNIMPTQVPYCTTGSISINLMFQKNFPTHTSLEPPEPSKWLPTERSEMSYLSVLQQQPILSQEHQSWGGQVFHHVHGWGRQPIDRNQRLAKSKAATPWQFVVVEPNHSWWWPFKSPTNMTEARTSSACTAAIDASKQSKIRSSRSGLRWRLYTERFCLLPQTLKTSISQQPHSNLGWWNAP